MKKIIGRFSVVFMFTMAMWAHTVMGMSVNEVIAENKDAVVCENDTLEIVESESKKDDRMDAANIDTENNLQDTVTDGEEIESTGVNGESMGFSFQYNASTGTAVVTGYNGTNPNIVIPAQTEKGGITYRVTEIADEAFYKNNTISSVRFEEGIRIIGKRAFCNCEFLQSVTMCNTIELVKTAGRDYSFETRGIFSSCENLKSVVLSNNLGGIPEAMFYGSGIESIQIPENIQVIEGKAFAKCASLRSVSFAGNSKLKEIQWEAFRECKSLTDILLPAQMEDLSGFTYCTNLASVKIPGSVKRINQDAFAECHSLSEVQFETPSSLKQIREGAFQNCNLTYVKLPEGLETIGLEGWSGQVSVFGANPIRKLILPKTLKNIYAPVYYSQESVLVVQSNTDSMGFYEKDTEVYGLLNSNAHVSAQKSGCSFFPIDAPTNFIVKKQDASSVRLSWNPVTPVSKYKIYRSNALNGTYIEIAQIQGTEYIDNTVLSNSSYFYKVCLTYIDRLGESVDGLESEINYVKDLKDAAIDNIPDLDFTGGALAPGITVRYDGKVLRNGLDYAVSYKNNVALGTATATIYALSTGEYYGTKEITFTIKLKTPSISNVVNEKSGIVINWKPVAGAEIYNIYRKTQSSGWQKIASVNAKLTSYTDGSVKSKNGIVYYYNVAASTGNHLGKYNPSGKKIIRLTISVKKITNKPSQKLVVKWKKNTKATGYQIQYSTSQKFKGAKRVIVKSMNKTSVEISKLKLKKKYYVRVRSYKKSGGKTYYSEWSSAKSKMIKK